MSDGTRGVQCVADVNREGWEKSDFPMLCETCMGDNPYVRMAKTDFGMQCKICSRPYTVFRWRPGAKARYTSTVICQTCAKIKNVCQKCIFDLEYGLPVEVRDQVLEDHQKMVLPDSKVGKQLALDAFSKQIDSGDTPYGKKGPGHHLLMNLKRSKPYYKRNETRICSFFVKGSCNRGTECPFRHELPDDGPLAHQRLRDRFHGVNDPVAAKIQRTGIKKFTLEAPEDRSVTTLFFGNLTEEITEQDLRDQVYDCGLIKSIRMMVNSNCAFMTFEHREDAEKAAEKLYKNCKIKETTIKLNWAKPSKKKQERDKAQEDALNASSSKERKEGELGKLGEALPYYPSMDPSAFGNTPLPADV